jgi:2-iminobutanoate/2-iminopropanoate deaminase
MRTIIKVKDAAQPVGPYNQAVMVGNLVFTAGQISLNKNGEIVGTDIETQTKQIFENLKLILKEAGSSLDNVIKTTVFLTDIKEFTAMNEIYSHFFTKDFPARSTVEVSHLPKNVKVEIEAIALID